jgi:hypothetical protein
MRNSQEASEPLSALKNLVYWGRLGTALPETKREADPRLTRRCLPVTLD